MRGNDNTESEPIPRFPKRNKSINNVNNNNNNNNSKEEEKIILLYKNIV